jgi:probable rRNA maturation factor
LATRNTTPARILVRSEHDEGAYAARCLRGYSRQFLSALRQRRELSVVITTDAEIRKLNRTWRQKDKPTDVLSFGQAPDSGVLGDVVISLDTARRQAAEGKRALTDELARLLAHGVLHLLGHDHEEPADARRMARAEVKLLGSIGMVAEALDHPADLNFTKTRQPRRSRRGSENRR